MADGVQFIDGEEVDGKPSGFCDGFVEFGFIRFVLNGIVVRIPA